MRFARRLLLGLAVLSWAALAACAQDGKVIFQEKCAACHTIGGGKLVGPDLQGVAALRDRGWLKSFISAPDQMIAQGDSVAAQLFKEFDNFPMPNLGLSEPEAEAILVFLGNPGGASAGGKEASLPVGDVKIGRELFTGARRLERGGTPCMACHNVAGVGPWGGGTYGPDLTHVIQRFGENGLSSALSALPFPSMQGAFKDKPLTPSEKVDLRAFFTQADNATTVVAYKAFVGAGGLGFLVFLGVSQLLWRRRFTAVRKLLVKGSK